MKRQLSINLARAVRKQKEGLRVTCPTIIQTYFVRLIACLFSKER